MYRLTDLGSELAMHANWLPHTAVEELVGPGRDRARVGFPLAYEVLPGNASDKETQMPAHEP